MTAHKDREGKSTFDLDAGAKEIEELEAIYDDAYTVESWYNSYQMNPGAYTMGRLLNEIGATMTEQNISDIASALAQKGFDALTARKNAEALAYVIEGGQLTDQQIAIIENNDALAEAAKATLIDANTTWNQRANSYKEMLQILANEVTSPKTSQTKQARQGVENTPAADTVDIQKENGTESLSEDESDYEVSAEGQTIRKDTGETVRIKEIASLKDGKMVLRLVDGSEIDSSEVAHANAGEAYVFETVTNLGVDAVEATRLVNAFRNSGVEGRVFADGIKLAFEYGYGNFSKWELAQKDFAGNIPQMYINTAYANGQKMRQQEGNNLVAQNSGKYALRMQKSTANDSAKSNSNTVDLSNDNELSKRVAGLFGAEKYKAIQQYILEVLGDQPITLKDGKQAVVDKSDALHIANKAASKKTAQIAKIKELVENADLYAEDKNVEHNKFDYFCYYKADVRYGEDQFPVYLNVGRGKNDGKYHVYDITNKIRDTADRINGLERPKPNEGYALTSGISRISIHNSRGNVKARGKGGVKYAFKGYAEDGKGIYESNFPKGTPKKAKGEKILEYIQNVWSKKPITLRVEDGNHTRLIKAQFDPTYDAEHGQRSDASKLMGGNRHGTSSEQRVTLDLADDYYQLAEDARYNYSKEETGKETATHKDVKRWHYFVNNIYFAEYGSATLVPYTVSINIKENPDGNYFYSFSAERAEKNGESPTQRTLHAVVNSSENTTANGKLSTDSIRSSRGNVKARGKGGVYYGYHGQRLNKLHLTAAQRVAVDFSERLAKKWGMTFYFYESQTDIFGRRIYRDKNGNWVQAEDGFYDPGDGSTHIDLNAGAYGQSAILFTVAHELTHHIQQWSPDAYHKLCDILTQGYLSAGQPLGIHIQLRQQLAQEAGRALTYKEAYDEVMAHSLESVLADGKVMQLLEQMEAEDKTLAARVRRFFRDAARLIWETVDTYWGLQPDSPEGRMVQQMKKLGAELEDAFAHGLYQAGQNFSQAEKSTAGNSSAGIQYAVREAFSSELQAWFDSTTHEERKVSGKRFLIGTTTDVLKSIGVKDYKIYFGGAKIDKILTGNSSMTLDTIKDAVMLLEDPILIMKSLTVENSIVLFGEVYTSGNKPVMISVLLDPTTKSGSVLDYAVITSAYGRRKSNLQHLINNSEIYYVNEQKSRTDKWLKALGLQLPSALTKYGSINSIHNADKDVKMRDSLVAYDTVVLEAEQTGESPSGSAKDMNLEGPFLSPDELSTVNVADLLDLVKGTTAKYIPSRNRTQQKNALAAAIRVDVVHAHEALLQEMTSRGIDQRNAKLAISALIDAAYTRATQRQVDFLRYMRTESPYAAQYNAALEAIFPGSTGTVTTAPAVGTDAYSSPTLGFSSVEDNAHTGPQAAHGRPYDPNASGKNTVMQEQPLDESAEMSENVDDFQTKVLEKSEQDDTIKKTADRSVKSTVRVVKEGVKRVARMAYAYSRPKYGKHQIEQVWEMAKDPKTGKVLDPSGQEIFWDRTKPRNGQWDMGHKPGEKYSEKHKAYIEGKITKQAFLEWYRDPHNYRPELPSTNRSHKYEGVG